MLCKTSVIPAIVPGSMLMCGSAAAQDKPAAADNTAVNKRDRNVSEPTADQQKMNKSDREITREIRKAIYADKTLSTYAHNIKIITQHGSVTLKGPVRTEDDKKNVEAKAAEVAGAGNVKSEIAIAPKKDKAAS